MYGRPPPLMMPHGAHGYYNGGAGPPYGGYAGGGGGGYAGRPLLAPPPRHAQHAGYYGSEHYGGGEHYGSEHYGGGGGYDAPRQDDWRTRPLPMQRTAPVDEHSVERQNVVFGVLDILAKKFGVEMPSDTGSPSALAGIERDSLLATAPAVDRPLGTGPEVHDDAHHTAAHSVPVYGRPTARIEMDTETYKKQIRDMINGPDVFPEYFVTGRALAMFDICVENSIWDYDPKFTWDYMPNTKRGTRFHCGFNMIGGYVKEEFKWKKYEHMQDRVWMEQFVPKVLECAAEGLDVRDIRFKKKVQGKDIGSEDLIKWYQDNVGNVPDDFCTREYCGICDEEFQSVMPSMTHYLDPDRPKHARSTRHYFVKPLLDAALIGYEQADSAQTNNIVNRLLKMNKTRPVDWQCVVCQVTLTSYQMAKLHFKGTQHQRRMQGLPPLEKVNPLKAKVLGTKCVLCGVTGLKTSQLVKAHCSSKEHIAKVKYAGASGLELPPGPSSKILDTTNMYQQKQSKAQRRQQQDIAFNNESTNAFHADTEMNAYYCAICHKGFDWESEYHEHVQSTTHLSREHHQAQRALKANRHAHSDSASGANTAPLGKRRRTAAAAAAATSDGASAAYGEWRWDKPDKRTFQGDTYDWHTVHREAAYEHDAQQEAAAAAWAADEIPNNFNTGTEWRSGGTLHTTGPQK